MIPMIYCRGGSQNKVCGFLASPKFSDVKIICIILRCYLFSIVRRWCKSIGPNCRSLDTNQGCGTKLMVMSNSLLPGGESSFI